MARRVTKSNSNHRLAAVAVFILCAVAVSAAPKISKLIVQPSAVELNSAGDEHALLVTAVTSDGTTIDATAQAKFISKQPKPIAEPEAAVPSRLGKNLFFTRSASPPTALSSSMADGWTTSLEIFGAAGSATAQKINKATTASRWCEFDFVTRRAIQLIAESPFP